MWEVELEERVESEGGGYELREAGAIANRPEVLHGLPASDVGTDQLKSRQRGASARTTGLLPSLWKLQGSQT